MADLLPPCPRCAGRTIFTGNERPDGRWTKTWKHHYLCTICQTTFYHTSDQASDHKVGEGNQEDYDAQEPPEQEES